MLIPVHGINKATKKNRHTGAVKVYYYHRRTGARLPDDPKSPEFLAEVNRLDAVQVGSPPAERTFKALMAEYKKSSDFADLAASTKAEYRRHIKYMEPLLGGFPVAALRPRHVEAIKQKYEATPTLAKAIARTLSVLLGYAVYPLEWLGSNPLVSPKRRGSARRGRRTDGQRPYEETELATFRARNPLGTRARLAFELALGTALRREDLCRVPAAAKEGASFSMIAGKNGELVVLPVTQEMRRAYRAYRLERMNAGFPESAYALCSESGTQIHKRTVSADIEEACKRAGFDDKQRLHALRYTAATRLFEAGLGYNTIQKLTGHRMAEMAKKYTEKKRAIPLKADVFNTADNALSKVQFHESDEDEVVVRAEDDGDVRARSPLSSAFETVADEVSERATRVLPPGRRGGVHDRVVGKHLPQTGCGRGETTVQALERHRDDEYAKEDFVCECVPKARRVK